MGYSRGIAGLTLISDTVGASVVQQGTVGVLVQLVLTCYIKGTVGVLAQLVLAC